LIDIKMPSMMIHGLTFSFCSRRDSFLCIVWRVYCMENYL